ncbi:hypothetical protein IHQ68_03440 [Chelatococcus sambhunathii]|uniref:Uncharacterized protein n=1 Tax=Chelatococcus sambhunathii TaxID=363953 RepID=A0ABU1DC76_9HYPH|nr:hypothetical protein [Chelatococcus sambhunathii]MDR4305676.1 hypothetical protein [Chelatococcus sambhunathii]
MRFRVSLVAVGILAAVGLTACRTTAAVEQDFSTRLQGYKGGTIAQFISRTTVTPSDAYPTSEGKVFVVSGDYRAPACKMLIHARARDASGTADSWIIERFTWVGPCIYLPI